MRTDAAIDAPDTQPMQRTGSLPTAAWIVEVLDRQRRVAQRVRVHAWPVTLGRGYGCDVQVDDPHMAAAHAQLTLDETGAVQAQDLGSLNGMRRLTGRDGHAVKSATHVLSLTPDTWVETGHTRWRVLPSNMPVAPERKPFGDWHAPAWVCLSLASAVVLAMMWDVWFNAVDEFKPLKLLSPAVGTAIMLSAWSGLWAVWGRLTQGPTQWLQHLGWASLVFIAQLVLAWLGNTLAFALDWPIFETGQRLLWLAVVVILLLGHISIVFGSPGKRTGWALAGLCAASLSLSVAESWQAHRQWLPESFMSVVRPTDLRAAEGIPLEQLMRRAAADQRSIDALRTHESQEDGDEP